jgi:hypothetical protein
MIAEFPYGSFADDSDNELIKERYQRQHQKHELLLLHDVDAGAAAGNVGLRKNRPTFADLLSGVQASEKEIVEGLSSCNAIEIDGKWCSIEEVIKGHTHTHKHARMKF